MFKLIIAGSRDFQDYEFLKTKISFLLQNIKEEIEIVSGKAHGADMLGERFAIDNGFQLKEFPADWEKYGRRAGPMRNEEMAKYANACVVFWKNKSKGSMSMINLAKKYNLKLRIYE